MKKFIAWLLLVTMLLGTFAGCSNTEQTPTQPAAAGDLEGITAAIDYLKAFYKDSGTETFADFERFGIVRIGGVPYEVVWTADVSEDLVKAVVNEDGTVTIDVNESCEESTPYVLTATVSDDAGHSVSHSWDYILPVGLGNDYGAIVDMAYALEKGQALEFNSTLVGTVTAINTPWSDEYKNITVTIVVEGREDQPIMCYRLKGDGAQDLAAGDLITVTGILKNYNGTIEFDSGCTLDKVEKGAGKLGDIPTDPLDIVDAAYALEVGASLPYTATLTGVISSIDTPYSADYKNITVSIQVEGREDKPIMCYRLKGDGADTLMPGDTITVTGVIKNYNDTIEFDAGCQLVSVVKGEGSMEILTDPAEIMNAAYELEPGESLPYAVTLTGEIFSIDTSGIAQYNNITVGIRVEGSGKKIICFRMKGENLYDLNIGDVITVTGNVKNYKGTIELDSGCQLISVEHNPEPTGPEDFADVLAEAKEVAPKNYLPYATIRTGVITNNPKHNTKYDSYSFYADIEGYSTYFYSVEISGGVVPEKGDTIWVKGHMTQHDGKPQFDYCSTVKVIAKAEPEELTGFAKQVADVEAKASGEYLGETSNVTGTVTEISYYNSKYHSYSFTMDVDGVSIYCHSLNAPEGVELVVGDSVTVNGELMNYNGSAQFEYKKSTMTINKSSEPELTGFAKQVADVEAKASGEYLGETSSVTGTVTEISYYNSKYHSYSFTMDVDGVSIYCHSLNAPEGIELVVGDSVTVNGELMNYNGTAQFEYKKSTMTINKSSEPELTGFAKQVADVEAKASGEYLGETSNVTGTVTEISYYNSKYHSYSFTMDVDGVSIYCHSLNAPEGVELVVGDSVTVNGELMNYNGTAQFEYKKSTMTINKSSEPELTGFAKQVADVEAKASGEYLGETSSVTGTVTSISYYNENYHSYSFTMDVDGVSIYCHSLNAPEGVELVVGDSVTVNGELMNYNGSAQFEYKKSTMTINE